MIKQLLAGLLLFVFAPLAFAEGYKVETIGALTETKVAEAMRKAVEEKGLRVVDDKGKAVCEVWFNKEIAAGKTEVPFFIGRVRGKFGFNVGSVNLDQRALHGRHFTVGAF